MARNIVEETSASAEEIAAVLSAELQKAVVQLIALKIENDKLRQQLKELTENTARH